jgi:inner membrane protein
MEEQSFIQKTGNKMRNSISIRLIVIGFLIILFLIPISLISDLVYERQNRKREAVDEVSNSWGYPQTIVAPYLSVPYWEYIKTTDEKGFDKIIKTKQIAYFLPLDLQISGSISPEIRYRGIYNVVVYNAKLNFTGQFDRADFEQWKIDKANIIWDEARINIGMNDLRSIKEAVQINVLDSNYLFNPGLSSRDLSENGISAPLLWNNDKNKKFNFQLDINGSSEINFLPLGKVTTVKINSQWANPKFIGAFLPETRTINDSGFVANWKVLHLNRDYPQSFMGSQSIDNSAFGVSLLEPVDEYQKNTRAGKYAVLFIALTFVIFFFMQILNKVMIHPIQYIIVGLALMVFYSLLIAISEQLSFNWAYIISSIAIISMIGLYVGAALKNKRLAMLVTAMLILLYLFIFTIIQLQDYSLLIGSIGLFLVLAAIMYLSRNIDWYNIDFDNKD